MMNRYKNHGSYKIQRLLAHTDASLILKLANKFAKKAKKRSKKNLGGLSDVLAAGSSVIKKDSQTSLIKVKQK